MGYLGDRRNFLQKAFSLAGLGLLPSGIKGSTDILASAPYVVEFKTIFPHSMSITQYRSLKEDFENKEKVSSLLKGFKRANKVLDEKFSFHGDSSRWIVSFNSKASYDEWMVLTESIESHLDHEREQAGFQLHIRRLA